MKTQAILTAIYLTILVLLTGFIWHRLYAAQFLEYDENYGLLISTFLLSVLAACILTVLWFKARPFMKQNAVVTVIFLIMSSPPTVALVFYFYHGIFGPLKN